MDKKEKKRMAVQRRLWSITSSGLYPFFFGFVASLSIHRKCKSGQLNIERRPPAATASVNHARTTTQGGGSSNDKFIESVLLERTDYYIPWADIQTIRESLSLYSLHFNSPTPSHKETNNRS